MTEDELFDVLTAIEERVPLDEKPAWFEREANDLEPGEHGRASLLIAAGEHWQMRKEYDHARRCFRLAMRDGGESASDPIANLLSLALDEGDVELVTELDQTLRGLAREDEVSPTTCHLVAEAYEIHGQLRQALRWYNIPFTHGYPDGDPADSMLLDGRRRVRTALGLAPDQLDVMAEELRQTRR
ncbi:hypothetical protein GCM10011376_34130 [Nocardioides flavus (ex Wang et al. 2016)]|uniref:Tetratricopeptide repeat protein n=1 Tax=Nocardioides flavus (ex Wang et al. 2016) TaxID=2058780 RepID=A0ABQ3HMB6_9ACTN|nr:hypothetical protein [Nocardioides flavus (ex Wang et al. 2016)]GHE18803.1 hypothetical protein GCM10011376_34130 [Nocardioides flavus (ex Wang et al. 2016)]